MTDAIDLTLTDTPAETDIGPAVAQAAEHDNADIAAAAPALTFADFGVHPALVDALAAKGIVHPFPIQAMTLPMALEGHDIIGQARTGTGKTLAFGLPILQRLDPSTRRVQALIITPTRELTVQVAADLQIGTARGLEVAAVYGGVPIEPQTDALLGGAQVVVGTPGRLLDHVGRGNLDLSQCTQLVLDEADEMLDMGFLPDIERLVAAIGGTRRHTMLFSATMPQEIVSLARRYMTTPTFLRASSDEPDTAPTVDQYFLLVHRMDKPRLLARIMQTPDRGGAFVFTRTKMMASRLVEDLEAMGIAAVAVHGDLRQAARERNLDRFRKGRADILVATEVAARGLDVDNVTHVINYDCPEDHKMYLHRIGRTARAGARGVAITFCEYNEVDRLNVIRKTIDAHDGDDPAEVFSSSELVTDWFDLPEETPWAAQRRKLAEDRESSSAARRTGGDRPKPADNRTTATGERTKAADDRAKRTTGDRGGPAGDRARGNANRDDRASSQRADREQGPGPARGRNEATSPPSVAPSAAPSTEPRRNRRDRADVAQPEEAAPARTRTRTDDGGDSGARRDRGARDTTAPPSSDEVPAETPAEAPAPRKRARTTRTAAATRPGDAPASEGRQERTASSRRGQDGRDSRNGSPRDGDRARRTTTQRAESGDRDQGGRSSADSGEGTRTRSSRGETGRREPSRGQSGRTATGRGQSSRGQTSRSQPNRSRDDREDAPSRTTADRPTQRGDDARGHGSPGLARRVTVENLP